MVYNVFQEVAMKYTKEQRLDIEKKWYQFKTCPKQAINYFYITGGIYSN